MIEFVKHNDEVKVQINNLEYDISGENWITLHPLQKCKSEAEASWLCSILNDAMERHERMEELREATKPTQLYFDPITCMYFRADPEEIMTTINNEFDLDLFLKCAKEYGAEIRPAKPGHGGIYVNGKKITKVEELFDDLGKDKNERSSQLS